MKDSRYIVRFNKDIPDWSWEVYDTEEGSVFKPCFDEESANHIAWLMNS